MPEPTPISGDALIQACAKAIKTRDTNAATIAARQNEIANALKSNERRAAEIATLATANTTLQTEIAAMTAAITGGTQYAPGK